LTRPAPERRRDRVLSADEIRTVWAAVEKRSTPSAAVVKLLLLTAQRIGEVRTMRWGDVDLDAGWWTIPGAVSKNGLPHRVPLSAPARSVLIALQARAHPSPFVFPARRNDTPLVTIKKLVRLIRDETGVNFTPHDLRRTAASHMTGMGVPRLTVAKLLNHAERDVTAVYDRHSYDPEKRRALDAWGERVDAIATGAPRSAKVVSLTRA
jgi:integrase